MPPVYKTELVEKQVLVDVICDMCGKSAGCEPLFFIPNSDPKFLEYMTLTAHWGHSSTHDMEEWEAYICNNCVDTKLQPIIKFKKKHFETMNDMSLGIYYDISTGKRIVPRIDESS